MLGNLILWRLGLTLDKVDTIVGLLAGTLVETTDDKADALALALVLTIIEMVADLRDVDVADVTLGIFVGLSGEDKRLIIDSSGDTLGCMGSGIATSTGKVESGRLRTSYVHRGSVAVDTYRLDLEGFTTSSFIAGGILSKVDADIDTC